MPAIRVRTPFAVAFGSLLLISAYLSLSGAGQKIPKYAQSDKGLHFITFFLLTIKLSFYWIFDTSRRRIIHLTLLTCTAGLAIGSEVVGALIPQGIEFDPFDILANVVGSTCSLLLSSWYHKRMLERRRKNKHFDIVPGEEEADVGNDPERDVELGEGVGLRNQETGVVSAEANGQATGGAAKPTNVTEELDNWDETMDDDWEEEGADAAKVVAGAVTEDGDTKKRSD